MCYIEVINSLVKVLYAPYHTRKVTDYGMRLMSITLESK